MQRNDNLTLPKLGGYVNLDNHGGNNDQRQKSSHCCY